MFVVWLLVDDCLIGNHNTFIFICTQSTVLVLSTMWCHGEVRKQIYTQNKNLHHVHNIFGETCTVKVVPNVFPCNGLKSLNLPTYWESTTYSYFIWGLACKNLLTWLYIRVQNPLLPYWSTAKSGKYRVTFNDESGPTSKKKDNQYSFSCPSEIKI